MLSFPPLVWSKYFPFCRDIRFTTFLESFRYVKNPFVPRCKLGSHNFLKLDKRYRFSNCSFNFYLYPIHNKFIISLKCKGEENCAFSLTELSIFKQVENENNLKMLRLEIMHNCNYTPTH